VIAIPRPPAIPASLAALVTLAGLALIYWSLTGLGLLRTPTGGPVGGGGFSGGSSGGDGGGAGGGF
jgi:hypothetical protein